MKIWEWGSHNHIIVIILESTFVSQYILSLENNVVANKELISTWDPTSYLSDPSGRRLMEEAFRRVRQHLERFKVKRVAISLPGTLQDDRVLLRSSRLGIYQPVQFTDLFERKGLKCRIFHDTEAIGFGEAKYGALRDKWSHSNTFAYILVDEGVGSTLFINGSAYKGEGTAGHIGRLVVNPQGPYNPVVQAHGVLEVYAARPWVSRRIVIRYLAEKGKRGVVGQVDAEFRHQIDIITTHEEKWSTLPYHLLSKGWKNKDSIAVSVIEEAAYYLGFSINIIMALTNPADIIIGGGMKRNIPGFYERILLYARRFSWANAWNRTSIRPAALDSEREAQIYGTAELFLNAEER